MGFFEPLNHLTRRLLPGFGEAMRMESKAQRAERGGILSALCRIEDLATTYSRGSYTTTTIGKAAFDGRVRDGNGSVHSFMVTKKLLRVGGRWSGRWRAAKLPKNRDGEFFENYIQAHPGLISGSRVYKSLSSSVKRRKSDQAARPISTGPLKRVAALARPAYQPGSLPGVFRGLDGPGNQILG
jgi:hypothetical protein